MTWYLWHCAQKDFRSNYRKLIWVVFEPTTTEFHSNALNYWAIKPWVQLPLRANFVQLLLFHLFDQFSHFILAVVFFSPHICFKRNLAQVITIAVEWIDTCGILHWRIFRSSYRKLAWVGFVSTTTEFRSNALTNWAIKPWVQFVLRANFLQLLLFHIFAQCSYFISTIAFVSRDICYRQSLAQVITWAAELNDTYCIQQWSIFRSSYRKLV